MSFFRKHAILMAYFPRAKTIRFNDVRSEGPGVGYYSVPRQHFGLRGPATFLRAKRWKEGAFPDNVSTSICCRHCGVVSSVTSTTTTFSNPILATSTPAQRSKYPQGTDLNNMSKISHIAPLPDNIMSEPTSPSKRNSCNSCVIYEQQLNQEVTARRILEDRLMLAMHSTGSGSQLLSGEINSSLLKIQEQNEVLNEAASQLASLANKENVVPDGGKINFSIASSVSQASFLSRNDKQFEPVNLNASNRRLTYNVNMSNLMGLDQPSSAKSIGNLDSFTDISSSSDSLDAEEIFGENQEVQKGQVENLQCVSTTKPTEKVNDNHIASGSVEESETADEVCENCSTLETELQSIKSQLQSIQRSTVPTDTYLRLEKELKHTKEFFDSLEKELDIGGLSEIDVESEPSNEEFRAEMKSSMSILKEHFQSTVSQLSSVNKEAETAKSSNSELKGEIEKLQNSLSEHVRTSEGLKSEISELMEKCCKHVAENEELQATLNAALTESSDLNESKIEALSEMSTLKDELELLVQKHSELQYAKKDIEAQMQTLADENTQLEKDLSESQNKQEELEFVLESYKNDINWKDSEIEAMKGRIEELKSESSKQKDKNFTEISEMQTKFDEERAVFRSTLRENDANIASLKDEISLRDSEIEEAKERISEMNSKLSKQKDENFTEMSAMQKEFTEERTVFQSTLRENVEHITLLKGEISLKDLQIEEAKERIIELKSEFSQGKDEYLNELSELQKTLDDKRTEFQSKLNENIERLELLKTDINLKDSEIEALKGRIAELTSEMKQQKGDYLEKQSELEKTLNDERTSFQLKISENGENFELLKKKFDDLNQNLVNYKSAIRMLLTQIESFDVPDVTFDSIGEVTKVFDSMKSKVENSETELKSTLAKFEEREATYETKIRDLKEQVNVLTSVNSAKNCEIEALKNENTRFITEKVGLQSELDGKDKDLYIKMSEIERLSEEVANNETTIVELKTRECELATEVNSFDKKFQELTLQLESGQRESAKINLELSDATALITEIRYEKQDLLEENGKLRRDTELLQESLESVKFELSEKEKDFKFAENEITQLKDHISNTAREFEIEKSINNSLAQKTDEAHLEIEKLNSKIETLENICKETQEREKDSEHLFQTLQNNLTQCKEELFVTESEVKELRLLLAEAREQIERRESMNGKAEAEVEFWKSRMNDAEEKLKSSLDPLQKENRLLFEKVHELQIMLREQEEITNYNDYKSAYEKLLKESTALSEELEIKNENHEKQLEQIVSLEGKLLSKEFQLNAALSENQRKAFQLSDFEKKIIEVEHDTKQNFKSIIEDLESKVYTIRSEKDGFADELSLLKKELAMHKNNADQNLSKLIEVEKERNDAISNLEVKKKSNDEILKKIFELIRGITKLELRVNQKSVEDSLRNVELGDVLGELDVSRDCLGQFEQYLNEQAILLQDKEQEILNLTSQLNETNEKLQMTLNQTDIENFEPSSDFSKWQEMFDQVSLEKRNLERSYHELRLSVEPFQDLLNQYDMEKKMLLQKSQSTEQQYSDLVDRYADLMGHQNHKQKIKHLNKLKANNLSLRQENYTLREEMQKMNEEMKKIVHASGAKPSAKSNVKSETGFENKSVGKTSTQRVDWKAIKKEFSAMQNSQSSENLVLRQNNDMNCQ
ncbi:uncharacterized protein LOC142345660 [Convolutriloba macropyga]|uniref:uncharacterized protein LOC142345660 n=1 Tax=Convolutriloba macropyga TaxID=536237 RepID=UPI003F51CA70